MSKNSCLTTLHNSNNYVNYIMKLEVILMKKKFNTLYFLKTSISIMLIPISPLIRCIFNSILTRRLLMTRDGRTHRPVNDIKYKAQQDTMNINGMSTLELISSSISRQESLYEQSVRTAHKAPNHGRPRIAPFKTSNAIKWSPHQYHLILIDFR